jgi:obg-like ATPase 1
VEKILKTLTVDGKDIRKADWSNKEVSRIFPTLIISCNLLIILSLQIDVVNGLQLLTAKPVTYLVNLSEKDYIRKKNKW